jgi:hypothetical protein
MVWVHASTRGKATYPTSAKPKDGWPEITKEHVRRKGKSLSFRLSATESHETMWATGALSLFSFLLLHNVIVGWVLIFWEVQGKSIDGDLNIDDESSEQRRFEPVKSIHHNSIGYQHVRTRFGITKKVMSLQANREHKQEQERAISNCRWMISSWKLGSYKPNVGETIIDRLI